MNYDTKRENYYSDREYYNRRYDALQCLFINFMTYQELNDEYEIIDVIREYIDTFDFESIKETIEEGIDILKIHPFPCEWVSGVANGIPYENKEDPVQCTKEELAIKFVTWCVKKLEEEGKKAGKL